MNGNSPAKRPAWKANRPDPFAYIAIMKERYELLRIVYDAYAKKAAVMEKREPHAG